MFGVSLETYLDYTKRYLEMMDELREILRTTVGKIIATVIAAAAAAFGAVQTGILDLDADKLNPIQVEQPVED